MILLTGTSDQLNILTGGAQSVDWNCSWNDMNYTAGTFLPGSAEGNIAAATTTNIVGAPASSVQRQIKFLSLTNKDPSNAVAITVIKSSGGTGYNLTGAWSIPAGWTLYYLDGQGFVVQNASGAIQYVGSIGPSGSIGAQGSPGVATYLEADPGEQGDQGFPGPTGPQGLTGSQGPVGPATYLEADATEGDIGPPGQQGVQGITGAQGPIGPPVYLDADAGDQGDQGFPGPTGLTGPQGLQGLQGIQGDQGDTGDDGQPIPGNQGIQGPTGATGAQGPSGYGPPGADGDVGDDGMPIPGNPGPTGQTGATGAQGPIGPVDNLLWLENDRDDENWQATSLAGVASVYLAPLLGNLGSASGNDPHIMWLEADRDDEGWLALLPNYGPLVPQTNQFGTGSAPGNDPHGLWLEADRDPEPWPQAVSGPTALQLDPSAGGLSAVTTIAATTTQTSGGITLQAVGPVAPQLYRVRAYGTFTAASSATARNAAVALFWGSVSSSALQVAVLVSTAQTTNWRLEFDVAVTSTTTIWVTGFFSNNIASTTQVVQTRQVPASVTVTAGTQTIDLRFNMSTVVAGDSWTIDQITLERIK